MATKVPKLEELKTRPCAPEELQVALVQLIELHNKLEADFRKMIASGRISSERDAVMNMRFDL